MSKYTVQIADNETAKIDVIECDCLFAGFSNEHNAGLIRHVKGTGLQIALAQMAAIKSVEDFDKEQPYAKIARELLEAHINEIISDPAGEG